MYPTFLTDARFPELLKRIDDDLAQAARSSGCPRCEGRLDQANYPRKPRGPCVHATALDARCSFCCHRDGCRKRVTPPSVRFLGRKVYLGAVVILASALRHGTEWSKRRMAELLGVSRRTLARWQTWWREAFPATSFWKAARGQLATPVGSAALPGALLELLAGSPEEKLVAMLRFLAPLSTAAAVRAGTITDGRR